MSRRHLFGAAAVIVPALVLGSAGTSFAASSDAGLHKAQHAATQAINVRLATLANDIHRLNQASTLTTEHRATLAGIIGNDVTGLRALRDKIAADTTVAQVKADAPHIYADYRVYALLNPQIATVLRGDNEASQISKLLASTTSTTGKNAYRTAQLNHARTLLTDGQTAIGAAETTALGFTPAQDADGVTPVSLVEARSSLSAVADNITAARNLIRAVRNSSADS